MVVLPLLVRPAAGRKKAWVLPSRPRRRRRRRKLLAGRGLQEDTTWGVVGEGILVSLVVGFEREDEEEAVQRNHPIKGEVEQKGEEGGGVED